MIFNIQQTDAGALLPASVHTNSTPKGSLNHKETIRNNVHAAALPHYQ